MSEMNKYWIEACFISSFDDALKWANLIIPAFSFAFVHEDFTSKGRKYYLAGGVFA
jgi:hypothetical protein